MVNCSNYYSLKFKDVLNSLAPVLTSSYSGLKELNIDVDARQFPNLDSLVVIVEHHCSLHTVSVECRHPSRAELNMSMQLMKPWLLYQAIFAAFQALSVANAYPCYDGHPGHVSLHPSLTRTDSYFQCHGHWEHSY